ncbi:formimidoylglutamate deiminase [Isoptericola sp. b490]|uniref:formimidoylglutamate deiminase n=1 Tax=Actinotalea lenta TaxID=3064654 RepID=UPI002713B210|nr:formimidoylglutamate deiminase [Isoptericola sp. b490]MDO8119814.1 formimidoylglutamate deiminase [Isoptericola sp. b490]
MTATTARPTGTDGAYWLPVARLGRPPAGRVAAGVRVRHGAGLVVGIDEGVPPSPGDVVLDGLGLPAFADAHSHAFHRALRGRTHAGGGTFWTWREQMYAVAARLSPEAYLDLATAVYAEAALSGVGVVGEFHYVHHRPGGVPYAPPTAMAEALVEAAARAGVRLTLLDTLYRRGGVDATGRPLPLSAEQRRFDDGSVEAWAARRAALPAAAHVRAARGLHSVRAVGASDLAAVAALGEHGPLHVHVAEQPDEVTACLAEHGLTPVGLLDRHGLLGPDLVAVHANHVTDADVALLAGRGAGVCACPTTERDLADGPGRPGDLAAAGVPLSLGTDQHAVLDLLEETRGLEMHERLRTGRRGTFSPAALLAAATAHGYAALGWDGGRLEVGAPCDLTVLDTASVRTVGARPDQLWLAATAADVRHTVVAGRQVLRDGRSIAGDPVDLLTRALAALDGPP